MRIELIIFIIMLVTFFGCSFGLKLPVSIGMMLAAVIGGIVGTKSLPIRHLVEGTFSYIDTILVITTAMVFMKIVEKSGALNAISASIIEKFHKRPAFLLCLIMLVIMFPGMITGSSTAAVLSSGYIIAPVLIIMGIPKIETAAILAMGGILGMIAPPVNVPAMIIGGGIDIPYVGFELPLALLTFPLAIIIVLFLGLKFVKNMDYEQIERQLDFSARDEYGKKLYIPIIVAIVLMVVNKVVPSIPDLGMPLVFVIASICGMFTGKKVKLTEVLEDSIANVLPVLGILMGVGMFIQIMTLTGVRGLIVTNCLRLPDSLRYIAMAVSIPIFGAVSSFGSASVLGVPFTLAFMAKDTIITVASISLIASLGDMMPPTALSGIFAAKVVGLEDDYFPVLKKSLIPCLIIVAWAILFIIFANNLAPVLVK